MEIILVYSGGTQNSIQQDSLGGFPSPVEVTNNEKNNLFNDIKSQQTTLGVTDYRCLYVFNDSENYNFDTTVFISYLNEIGSTLELGLLRQNAVQNLEFSEIATSGTFTITIQGLKSNTITWDNDSTILANNIETALQAVSDCTVEIISSFYYKITFKGILGNKALTDMSITDNNLEPYGTIIPTVSQVIKGSPINTVAPDTGIENLSPTGVPFASIVKPGIEVGTLFPSEGFPIWFKRSIEAGFDSVEGDGFNLHIQAKISS